MSHFCGACGEYDGRLGHLCGPTLPEIAPAVPSVGLRDRVACELANLEYERSGRLCETEDFYADADRVLSVLHEAGTQGDWQQARTVRHLLDRIIDGSMANGPTDEDINSAESITGWIAVTSPGPAEAGTQEDSLSQLVSDTGLIREVARANVELIDLSEKINAAVERWTAEAKRRKEDLTASPAEAGTQEDEREVLRVVQDDNGYAVILPGDGEWARADDPALLENYVAQVLYEARTFKFTGPAPAVSGTPDTKEDEDA